MNVPQQVVHNEGLCKTQAWVCLVLKSLKLFNVARQEGNGRTTPMGMIPSAFTARRYEAELGCTHTSAALAAQHTKRPSRGQCNGNTVRDRTPSSACKRMGVGSDGAVFRKPHLLPNCVPRKMSPCSRAIDVHVRTLSRAREGLTKLS